MLGTQTFVETLVVEKCYLCHCSFGLSQSHYNRARNYGEAFFCPSGHSQVYTTTRVMELEKNVQALRDQRDRAEARVAEQKAITKLTEKRLQATKGVVTRTKNRIAKGICPCCNRYFAKLHQHMASQHPDYVEQ